MKTVAIVCKWGHATARETLDNVVSLLLSQNCYIHLSEDYPTHSRRVQVLPEEEMMNEADLVVVLGGDGTLLHAVHLLNGRDIPVLGINLGTLGFMTEVQKADCCEALKEILQDNYQVTERRMLNVTLFRGEKEYLQEVVLNDVVINKATLARIIRLEAYLNGQFMTSYRGDGLIVSTPTGSTAYNMAAGGPVLYPTLNAFVLTPICPHTFANRPVVVAGDKEVEIDLPEANGEVYLTLDGQEGVQILEGDRVRIRQSSIPVKLIQSPTHSYFDILRQKLGWGQN